MRTYSTIEVPAIAQPCESSFFYCSPPPNATNVNRSQFATTVVLQDCRPDLARPPPSESLIRYPACKLAQTPHDYFNWTYFQWNTISKKLTGSNPPHSSVNVQKPIQAYWFKLPTRVPLMSKNQPESYHLELIRQASSKWWHQCYLKHVHSAANSSSNILL